MRTDNLKDERYEALYRINNIGYLYVQYTADDPEYDFDYTVFDNDFHDVDGGVIGVDTRWDLDAAADAICEDIQQTLKSRGFTAGRPTIWRLDIDAYMDKLEEAWS